MEGMENEPVQRTDAERVRRNIERDDGRRGAKYLWAGCDMVLHTKLGFALEKRHQYLIL